jgi:hypothetical protein
MKELAWWMELKETNNGLPIHRGSSDQDQDENNPRCTVYVDAFDSGWGVSSELVSTHGFWSATEKDDSINVRELKTILFAVKLHAPKA